MSENDEQQVELVEQGWNHQVTLVETPYTKPDFILIQPGNYSPRVGPSFQNILSKFQVFQIDQILSYALQSEYLALDFETRGGDYSRPELEIVGIGLAWATGSCYLDFQSYPSDIQIHILNQLSKHPKLIAHNVYFDGGVWYSKMGQHAQFYACTYALYKQIANEGYVGQKWSLKDAMVDCLGWSDSNEAQLDEWLVVHGYYKGTRLIDVTEEYLRGRYLDSSLRPDKGEMWRAPAYILGKYSCLDAEACYLLFMNCFLPILEQFPALQYYHCTEFMYLIRLHIEQKMYGISMDHVGLVGRAKHLLAEIERLSREFLCHPEVQPHVSRMEEKLLADLKSKEPPKYKKQKLPREPGRYKKDGSQSKSWTNWYTKYTEMKLLGPEISKNWINWHQKYTDAASRKDLDYIFNMNSTHQLVELLHERMGYPVSQRTETGIPAVGVSAFLKLGPIGQLLIDRAYLNKELSYIQKYLELTSDRPTLHPSFRTPGPITGRMSSSEPNLQQVPKSKEVMKLFQAFEGEVWADIDFKALESVVAAELSGDENLHQLYGTGKPENDVHCFIAAQTPGLGDAMLAAGYDPYNPTRDSLAAAKKCKKDRGIAKGVVYSAQYGAGTNKMYQVLVDEGVDVTWEQVDTVRNTYWKLFSGLKEYGNRLKQEWKQNGYIINGIGRPMCLVEGYEKDLLSRQLQSTGHDLLVKYIYILGHRLDEVLGHDNWRPVLIDLHDATTVAANEEHGSILIEAMQFSMQELNRQVGGDILLSGVPILGRSLADCKEPTE